MGVTTEQEALYQAAVESCKNTFVNSKIAEAAEIFASLGDYEDSANYKERCEKYLAWQEGSIVTFGEMDGKPIQWKVVKEAGFKRLLLAEHNVAFMPYNVNRDHTNWSGCTVRRWLNKEFMDQAFTLRQRMQILLTEQQNNIDPRWSVENGPATKDKAFIFSSVDVAEYLPNMEDRATGEWWWLRNHGSNLLSPMAVYTDGTIYDYGVNKNAENVGIRAAMWIKVAV